MNCEKCEDTGWVPFTRSNKIRCGACCKHDKGWWELKEEYYKYIKGTNNNCCKNGCGKMQRDLECIEKEK